MCDYMETKVFAGIVTYNPQIERLKNNITAICDQVITLVIVDNGSANVSEVKNLVDDFPNTILIQNEDNKGIARALNQIMEFSKREADWVLLLDQDSVAPEGMIEQYKQMIALDKVAIICPLIFDNNSRNLKTVENSVDVVGICITSGSMNNVRVWEKLGGFDEELFIDSVDNEYCIKLFFAGYKIYRNNKVLLNHELGKTEKHVIKSTTNHNAIRRYYIARNSIYVSRKYHWVCKEKNANYKEAVIFLDHLIDPIRIIIRQLQFILLIALYESDKKNKIKSIITGMRDGNKLYKGFVRDKA